MVKGDNNDPAVCAEPSGCDTVAVNVNDKHAVRCCSDVPIAGWKKGRTCDVWGGSNIEGKCSEMNWSDARKLCESQSSRLCTRTELERSCASETGCSFDTKLVWSSTPAADGNRYLYDHSYFNHYNKN